MLSEIGQIPRDSTYVRYLELSRVTEMKSRGVIARGRGWGAGVQWAQSVRLQDEKSSVDGPAVAARHWESE